MKREISIFIKPKFILTGLLLTAQILFAVAATPVKQTAEFPEWLSSPLIYLFTGAIIVLLMVVIALANTSVGLLKTVSKVKRPITLTLMFFLVSLSGFSQATTEAVKKGNNLPEWAFKPEVYLIAFIGFMMLITIYILFVVNMKLIKAMTSKAAAPAAEQPAAVVLAEQKPGFLRRVYLRMVDSVPVAHEKDILLDHDYDGIKELDNNLPPWWKYGFYVTIIFGFFYLMIYHVTGAGKLQGEEYNDELLLAEQQKEARLKASADNVNEDNVTALSDPELVAKGKETYQKLCVACHLIDGGGQVGPNLTDEYWLHGGGIKNIFKTITYGVQNKGMISWKSQLSPKQIQQVASYILTFKGTKPAAGKEPQGDKWVEEGSAPADSSAVSNLITDSATVASTDTIKK